MQKKNEIKEKCLTFYNEIVDDSDGRYKSWEYCYEFFQNNKDKSCDGHILEQMCLHLAFYLASWGMLRGSSFLLKKSYKVHMKAIEIMMKKDYAILHNIKAVDLINEVDLLLKCDKEVRSSYENQFRCNKPSDTLITKIFLGVYGCVPAYDRYFKDAIKLEKDEVNSKNYCATFNRGSVLQICDFFVKHTAEFSDARKEINNDLYTDMKLLDMYFWQKGKELDD